MKITKYFFVVFFYFILIFSWPQESISVKANPEFFSGDFEKFPALIWNTPRQPDPSIIPPAIFYSPHQDDETIGMGTSIAEHVRAGRPVYVVLLTNGANTAMLSYIQQNYNPGATMQDVINARNNEFIAAVKALGVHRIYIANNGSGFDESKGFDSLVTDFTVNTINFFKDSYPDAAHKTTSGNCDTYTSSCSGHLTHQAIATAFHNQYTFGSISDIRFYRVYVYYRNYGNCSQSEDEGWFKPVNASDKTKRIKAINEYKYVNASMQRYGLGYYASVQTLFDNSINSDYEYVDYPQNDCH